MAKRSLNQQLQYAISQNTKFGKSKHAENRNKEIDNKSALYSINRTEDMRETVKSFCTYIAVYHPEIKMARDLTNSHVQGYLRFKAPVWSEATAKEIASRFAKLDRIVANTYKDTRNFGKDIEPQYEKAHKLRDKAMAPEHFERLRESFSGSRSVARDAVEITSRIGLRVSEVAALKSTNIDIANRSIHVSREGAKNGRARDIPIREKDITYFRDLCERTEGYICNGVTSNSINKAVRREMAKIYLDDGRSMAAYYRYTTEHSIRKLYAHVRMEELRGVEPLENKKAEMRAFDIVCRELGHGENRPDLYNTYIR